MSQSCNVHSALILLETTLADVALPFWVWVGACVKVEEGGGLWRMNTSVCCQAIAV
jgi:hypothetical protein